jgi:quercetin dioxygenase-like cupin family protein
MKEEGVTVRAVDLSGVDRAGGVVWSVSPDGFHANLVVLDPGGSIAAHRNDALDVLIVVLTGAGTVTVDDTTIELASATALLVPRGTTRSVIAGSEGLRYLTIHRQRAPLAVGTRRQTDV